MQMIGGCPDGNDSNLLRHDPVLQMLVGKAALGTADATLASQPTMSRLENGFTMRQLVRAFDAMVDNFIPSYSGKAPAALPARPSGAPLSHLSRSTRLGSTACIVYGQQELGMFSTHVGDTCLMSFYLYEGQSGRLIATALHPGKTATAKAIIGILRRVGKKLR